MNGSWFFATLLGAAFFVTAAGGARVDPRLLVLAGPDVPAGFHLHSGSSRYWSNTAFARGEPRLLRLVLDSGRVTGYSAVYDHRVGPLVDSIYSLSELCRTGAGAQVLFDADDVEQRRLNALRAKRGGRLYERRSVPVGDQAWLYRSTRAPRVTLVFWRAGRVVATVLTWGLSRDETVELARAQQRRIHRTLG